MVRNTDTDGKAGTTGTIKFQASNNWNNCYIFVLESPDSPKTLFKAVFKAAS